VTKIKKINIFFVKLFAFFKKDIRAFFFKINQERLFFCSLFFISGIGVPSSAFFLASFVFFLRPQLELCLFTQKENFLNKNTIWLLHFATNISSWFAIE
jgi:hypothetical protein